MTSLKTILRSHNALSCLFLTVVTGLGNFVEIGRFTLYADDWAYLGGAFDFSQGFVQYWNSILPNADARPLQLGLIELEAEIMYLTGGLVPAYLFLYLVTLLSVLAMWRVLLLRFSNAVAVTAAAIYAISPLVSIRPFLNGIASPFAVLCVLLACLLHSRGRWVAAYLVSLLVLASYELMFPLFVLLPAVLRPLRRRRDLLGLGAHVLICAVLLLVYAWLKDRYGAARLSAAMAGQDKLQTGLDVILTSLVSMKQALIISLDLPLWGERIGTGGLGAAWVALGFAGFALMLYRIEPVQPAQARRSLAEDCQTIGLLFLATLTAYFLSYFGPERGQISIFGRVSRFHGAACVPLGILSALLLVALLRAARPGWQRAALISLEAAYLAVMFGFSISHQDDFAAQTERQRRFVARLVADHPLMDPQATFVLQVSEVSWKTEPSIEYVDQHSYYPLLGHLFVLPPRTQAQPGPVIRTVLPYDWSRTMRWGDDGKVYWPSGAWPPVPQLAGHIWFYDYPLGGAPVPVPGPIMVDGHDVAHEGPDDAPGMIDLGKVGKRRLYHILFDDHPEDGKTTS
jgi:hypothetical protein